jgi:HEAT repeat protein
MGLSSHPLDIHGHRISSRDLQVAQRISITASCLGMMWISLTFAMPLTMFMEAVGASGVLIGLMTTMRLLSLLMQVPGGLISEHLGSRKKFWAPIVMVHRSMWLGVAALALMWKPELWWLPAALVALVAASDFLGSFAAAAWFSWMADLIPARTSGRFWGTRQTFVTAASLGGLALGGYILDLFRDPGTSRTSPAGFALVFGLGAIAGVVDIVVHLLVKEPMPTPLEQHRSILARVLAPLKNHDLRQLTLAFGAWNFALAMVGAFGNVYLKRDFQVTYTELAALSIAGSLGAMCTGYTVGHLTDRLGARVFGAVLLILAPITQIVWLFISDAPVHVFSWTISKAMLLLLPAGFVAGGTFSALALCQLRMAPAFSTGVGRTTSMAVHWSVIGLISALGPTVGGSVMDLFARHPLDATFPGGTPVAFFHILLAIFALVCWGVALPLLLGIRSAADEVPLTAAMSRLFLINPLNAVRSLYNIHVVSTHTSSRQRALAARSLGMMRSELAVPDLTEKLDDPSMHVQEHAIEALGAIGSAEAIEGLLRKLEDPFCDLAPQICRALRRNADASCVEPLLRKLSSPDRETLCESVHVLAEIGDRRAVPHLLNLIKETRDNKVLATASDALATLGELSAAHQIIPQIRAATNRTLKRTLVLAAGDLLGERDSFYKLLITDLEEHGAGASAALRDLQRATRKRFPEAATQIQMIGLIDTAYLNGEVARSAEMLLHLGLHLVQFIHRVPLTLDPNRAMENLLDRDRRSAMGIWYLKVLSEPWETAGRDTRDLTDVLLGIHVIAGFMQSSAEPR